MAWVVQGNPNLPAGQASSAQSAPVVIASDNVLNTDIAAEIQLNEIRSAIMGLAAAKGIAADLRVTVLNPTGTAVTISSGTVTAVTNVSNPLPRTTFDVLAQCNLTAQAFSANIVRS